MHSTSSFEELIKALYECEESDGNSIESLKLWLSSPSEEEYRSVNSDVIVGINDNRGSPLLIACELDLPHACKALISSFDADVNYRHPSPHGNTPLLRCAEMGYEDCLRVLLDAPNIRVVDCFTKEYKIVLGQSIPQYEAGGRSALILAIEANRIEVVNILLQNEQGKQLIKVKDSFGRNPLEIAFEKLALSKEGSNAMTNQEEICKKLCLMDGLDYDVTKENLQPTTEEAKKRERQRNVTLRARYLKNLNQDKLSEILEGLKLIKNTYKSLHPKVYNASEFDSNDLLLESSSKILVGDNSIKEPLPGTFSFPFLKKSYCLKIYEEILNYERVAKDRHGDLLPLPLRHDGNIGPLQDCGFKALLQAIEKSFQPLVQSLMKVPNRIHVYHAFLTRNYVSREEDFKIHRDKSDLTFNICLQASDDLEGSTVGFYRNSLDPSDGDSILPPNEIDRVYTHIHQVGHAIIHSSKQWHKTDTITRGTRSSLIIWARLITDDDYDSCR